MYIYLRSLAYIRALVKIKASPLPIKNLWGVSGKTADLMWTT